MQVEETRDRDELEALLREDAELHLYELGDLDPWFWPRTRWFLGRDEGGVARAVAMVYAGHGHSALLALGREGDPWPAALLEAARERLPASCYAHLQPGLAARLAAGGWRVEPRGEHLKQVLRDPGLVAGEPARGAASLGPADLPALLDFYARAYPDNWFDPRMLETGHYVGVREGGTLVAAAGVHVFAPEVGVAALGNITTDPARRGQGLARAVTAAVCRGLLASGVTTIGLNVKADNAAAIACYERLGFVLAAPYLEAQLERS
ncbi:MAG: GNAT family N-acetyltransferase [Planctomycetota bacterium]